MFCFRHSFPYLYKWGSRTLVHTIRRQKRSMHTGFLPSPWVGWCGCQRAGRSAKLLGGSRARAICCLIYCHNKKSVERKREKANSRVRSSSPAPLHGLFDAFLTPRPFLLTPPGSDSAFCRIQQHSHLLPLAACKACLDVTDQRRGEVGVAQEFV